MARDNIEVSQELCNVREKREAYRVHLRLCRANFDNAPAGSKMARHWFGQRDICLSFLATLKERDAKLCREITGTVECAFPTAPLTALKIKCRVTGTIDGTRDGV